MLAKRPHLILALLLIIIAGCGKGNYDKLIKTRIDQLNDPAKFGILIWEEYESPDGYSVSMPKGELTTDTKEENGIRTDTRDVTFGSKRYQFVYTFFPEQTQPESFAQTVEEQYRNSGYVDVPEDQMDSAPIAPAKSVKSLNLRHPEFGRARVEVVPLNNRAIATMAVLAADLTEEDCSKFFNSADMTFLRR